MLRVGICDGQEIFSIYKYTTFLHNSERSLGTSLFHIPKELVFNTIADSLISCSAFFFVEFTITIFIEELRNDKVTAAYVTITIKIEGDVWDSSSTASFLKLSVCFDLLTVGLLCSIGVFTIPPSGYMSILLF